MLSRTESSLCRAVYRPHVISNRHPQRFPRITGDRPYDGWLRLPHPAARVLAIFACSRVPPPADQDAGLLGYRAFSMSGSTWPRTPESIGTARRGAGPVVACRRVKAVGTHPLKFLGLTTFKVGSTRYLYTSPAYQAYASTRPLRCAPQGSILGSRLTSTQVGFAPTRLRDIAKPHCPLYSRF